MLKWLAILFAAASISYAMFCLLADRGGETFGAVGFLILVAWILGFGVTVLRYISRRCSTATYTLLRFSAPIVSAIVFLASSAFLGDALARAADNAFLHSRYERVHP